MMPGYTYKLACSRPPARYENYHFHIKHRGNPSHGICTWIITTHDEAGTFVESQINGWIEDSQSWGLFFQDQKVSQLGINSERTPLFVAKFVCDLNTPENLWHGYPADFGRNTQDKPPVVILQQWRNSGHIRKRQMSKIRSGISCTL